MILSDVNVLVYAHRESAPDHPRFRDWLTSVVNDPEPFAVADVILSGFVRVVTHPGIFKPPTPLREALEFCTYLRRRPNAVSITPGERHWDIFTSLCTVAQASGGLVTDAYIAALAIEANCELITTDFDFRRFPGLRWRPPF